MLTAVFKGIISDDHIAIGYVYIHDLTSGKCTGSNRCTGYRNINRVCIYAGKSLIFNHF